MKTLQKGIKILREEGITHFLKKSFRFLERKAEFLLLPYFIFKLRRFKIKTLEGLVNFAFNFLQIKPSQIKEEILELLKILEKRKPRTILEIGTANGGTLFLFSKIVADNATIISVDLPGGKFGGGYPKWRILLYKAFAKGNQKIYLLREDSHQGATLEKIKKILDGQKLDFLFIDGDHSYEGVKRDFKMYSRLLEREKIIAFHDVVHHPYAP